MIIQVLVQERLIWVVLEGRHKWSMWWIWLDDLLVQSSREHMQVSVVQIIFAL